MNKIKKLCSRSSQVSPSAALPQMGASLRNVAQILFCNHFSQNTN